MSLVDPQYVRTAAAEKQLTDEGVVVAIGPVLIMVSSSTGSVVVKRETITIAQNCAYRKIEAAGSNRL